MQKVEEEVISKLNNTGNVEKIANTKQKIKKVNIFYRIIKRLFDIVIGVIGCIILIPLTIVVYIMKLVNRENGPIFYEQLRFGKNGKIFRMYKFRSMIVGADKILDEYLETHPEAQETWENERKLKNDPRITKTGKFLRKTSLDEFPQFINIIIGNMSVIGPRPIVTGEIEKYGLNMNKFLSVKPGITGYWQVSGRSNTTYEERMRMELYYIDHQSLWLDAKIFFKTFAVVWKREGAE